ncbi:hypothetical protein EKK58_05190 [Candidatus Dependentiae bacterium]|nr:MAG: hypothetical protein EKK58_05190 [Candidatus Dependentiae bacterium]
MSVNVMRFAILHHAPNGAHVFELMEQAGWAIYPSWVHDTKSIELFEVGTGLMGPWALPEHVARYGWRLIGMVRHSTWRLLLLAERARALGYPDVAAILCREALAMPVVRTLQGDGALGEPWDPSKTYPAILGNDDAQTVRAIAMGFRRSMLESARMRNFAETLFFCAAGRIVRAELILVRMSTMAGDLHALGGWSFGFCRMLHDLTRRLGDAFTERDVSKARGVAYHAIRIALESRAETHDSEHVTECRHVADAFSAMADRYVAQAWG